MLRIIEDIKAKVSNKTKTNSFKIFAILTAFLDVNVWIVVIYRLSSMFVKLKLYPIGKVFWLINRIVFTVDIDPRANLAGGLVLVHGMNIVIGHEVKSLGELTIYHGATLGGNSGKQRIIMEMETGQPVLNEGVIIGINSSVLGPIIIEEYAKVGTGAIVTKDIPAKAIVVSVNKII